MPPLEGGTDDEGGYDGDDGDGFITRRALSIQPKENEEDLQCKHIFHTRCTVNNKVHSMIINSGSCINVASTLFINKLNLETKRHLRPYKRYWLAAFGDMKVTKQVLVPFSIN